MGEQDHKRSKIPVEALFLALTLWLLAIVSVLYGSKDWLPALASQHGLGIDRMLNYLMVTVGALFLCGHLVLGYVVLKFGRQRREATRTPTAKVQRRWSVTVAVLVALIAEGGVLFLGLPVWKKIYATAAPSDAVTIEVTGEQFAWNVRYPGPDGLFGRSDPRLISLDNPLGLDSSDLAAKDDLVLLGIIYIPVNQPTHIRLRSKDVLHSFFLPNFRVKQDAIPGMTIDLWFVPTKVGTYEIACAELCGFGHYNMRGILYVVSPDEYRQRLKEEQPFFS